MASVMHELLPLNQFEINQFSHWLVTNEWNFIKLVLNMYHYDLIMHDKAQVVTLDSTFRLINLAITR